MDPDKSGTIVSPKVCPAPILIEYPLGIHVRIHRLKQ